MTYLDALYDIVKSDDKESLMEWLTEFAYWFDPGGYMDAKDMEKYFLQQEWDYARWIEDHSQTWITPGGDPVWVCENCGGGRHVYGIECYNDKLDKCPECGKKMIYFYGR